MVFDESGGLVKSDNYSLVRLSGTSLWLSWQDRSNLVSLLQVHSCLGHLGQHSCSCRCRSYHVAMCLHSRSYQNVCKNLRPVRLLAAILCTYRMLLEPLEDRAKVVLYRVPQTILPLAILALQFSHSEHHGAIPFLIKYGMDKVLNVSLANRFVYSVGIKRVPQMQ